MEKLHALRVLCLSRNGLSGWLNKWVGWLTNLQGLYLDHNKLRGQLPDGLGRLKK